MAFTFDNLSYPFGALEPHIDAKTMEIHHGKHHKTYFDKFTEAVKGTPAESKTLEQVLASDEANKGPVRNNGGGYYNHNLFWKCMAPSPSAPAGNLAAAINSTFGSYDNLKTKMTEAGIGRFGSGFVWLIKNAAGQLEVCSTPNQDNPLMPFAEKKGKPVFCLDVWEHAYYLNYQNRRPDYIKAFWNVACWKNASALF